MPTMCIQCAMRALIDQVAPPVFDETPEAHQQRVHPDLAVTLRERAEMERALAARLNGRPREARVEPDASIFRQVKPCSDCPFRRDGAGRAGHTPQMLTAYASYFTEDPGASFPCHQSVPKDDARATWSAWREGQTVCAGGLIFAEQQGCENALMRIGRLKGWYDPRRLQETETVVASLDELLAGPRETD